MTSVSILDSDAIGSESVMLEGKEVEVAQIEEHLGDVGDRAPLLHHSSLGSVDIRFDLQFDLPGLVRHNSGPSLDPDCLGPDSHLLSHLHSREGDLLLFLDFHNVGPRVNDVRIVRNAHLFYGDVV